MSNRVTIEPTEFKNIRTGITSIGVRVYDDYDQAYDNCWEEMPDNDMGILRRVLDSSDEAIQGMMDFICEYKSGVYIGNCWHDWEEIEQTMKENV